MTSHEQAIARLMGADLYVWTGRTFRDGCGRGNRYGEHYGNIYGDGRGDGDNGARYTGSGKYCAGGLRGDGYGPGFGRPHGSNFP
jgi:hypothetical protein